MEDSIRSTIERNEKFNEVSIKLEDAIEQYIEWMAENRYTQSTRHEYKWNLEHFLSFIKAERYDWEDIFTQSTLTQFNQLKKGNSYTAVRGLSKYLYVQGKITKPLGKVYSSVSMDGVFGDYLCYRRKYHQVEERTIRATQRVLKKLAHYLEEHDINLASLDIEQLDRFLTHFLKGFSYNTCRAYRGYLRGFFSYLFHERGLLSKDLSLLIINPPLFAPSKPPKFLCKDDIKRLFEGLSYETASELRTAAIIHLAYMVGLRPYEISRLKLDDVNFGKAEIYLRQRKNHRSDKLPLPEPVLKVLAAYLLGGRPSSEHRAVFLTLLPPYRPLNRSTVIYCIQGYMQKIGLDATAYWLRHTYAQNLLEAGSSLYEVKEMLGHDSIESTGKYLHIHLKLMREVLFDETL